MFKFCDFGVSEIVENNLLESYGCGSPAFMSPQMKEALLYNDEEQKSIKAFPMEADKVDIYSLGIVLLCIQNLQNSFSEKEVEDYVSLN